MANSTVCQSKWKPTAEPRRAKPKTTGMRVGEGEVKALLQPANLTLGPDATHNHK